MILVHTPLDAEICSERADTGLTCLHKIVGCLGGDANCSLVALQGSLSVASLGVSCCLVFVLLSCSAVQVV